MSDRRCGSAWSVPTPSTGYGGVQNHVLGLARYLREHGHAPHILAPGSADPTLLDDLTFTSAGTAVPVPYNGSVARVNFGLADRRPGPSLAAAPGAFDVLHIHEPVTPSVSLLALWLRRVADRGHVPHRHPPVADDGGRRRSAARLDRQDRRGAGGLGAGPPGRGRSSRPGRHRGPQRPVARRLRSPDAGGRPADPLIVTVVVTLLVTLLVTAAPGAVATGPA